MIDIGEKKDTERKAVATGSFFAKPETISRIREKTLPKGDVLVLAEVAGILGAKNTSNLLPLCHPLSLTSVRVSTEVQANKVNVFCEVKTIGKTGVEMEALCGVNAALLCIYDLTKGIDPVLEIGDIRLELKEGGKSGRYLRAGIESRSPVVKHLESLTANVIVLSDRCFQGRSVDQSGMLAERWLKEQGASVNAVVILPDDLEKLDKELRGLIQKDSPNLIITSGGTGLSPRDITPETVLALSIEMGGRELHGIGEILRSEGS